MKQLAPFLIALVWIVGGARAQEAGYGEDKGEFNCDDYNQFTRVSDFDDGGAAYVVYVTAIDWHRYHSMDMITGVLDAFYKDAIDVCKDVKPYSKPAKRLFVHIKQKDTYDFIIAGKMLGEGP